MVSGDLPQKTCDPSGYDCYSSPWLSHGPNRNRWLIPNLNMGGSFHGELLVPDDIHLIRVRSFFRTAYTWRCPKIRYSKIQQLSRYRCQFTCLGSSWITCLPSNPDENFQGQTNVKVLSMPATGMLIHCEHAAFDR